MSPMTDYVGLKYIYNISDKYSINMYRALSWADSPMKNIVN